MRSLAGKRRLTAIKGADPWAVVSFSRSTRAVRAEPFDSIASGQRWSVELNEVHEVDLEKRGMNPISGALRKRLRLACTGKTELFVVNHVDEVIDVLKTAITV